MKVYEITEKRLIDAVIDGDPNARREFALRYGTLVFKVAKGFESSVRKLDTVLSAEDLTQDVFEHLFKDNCRVLKQWRPSGKFSSWLYTVADNACTSILRRLRTQNRIYEWELGIDYDDPPENITIKRERDRIINTIIDELPEEYRIVVELFYYDGKTYKEISDSLNISIKTVGSRLFRAREQIKNRLKEYPAYFKY